MSTIITINKRLLKQTSTSSVRLIIFLDNILDILCVEVIDSLVSFALKVEFACFHCRCLSLKRNTQATHWLTSEVIVSKHSILRIICLARLILTEKDSLFYRNENGLSWLIDAADYFECSLLKTQKIPRNNKTFENFMHKKIWWILKKKFSLPFPRIIYGWIVIFVVLCWNSAS